MKQAYSQIMPFYNLISKSKRKKTRHHAVSCMTTIIRTLTVFAKQYKRKSCPQWSIPRKILMKIGLIGLMLLNHWFPAMWKLKCLKEKEVRLGSMVKYCMHYTWRIIFERNSNSTKANFCVINLKNCDHELNTWSQMLARAFSPPYTNRSEIKS